MYLTNQVSDRVLHDGVSYAIPMLTPSQYDDAGKTLVKSAKGSPEKDAAIQIVGQWRNAHVMPMVLTRAFLNRTAKPIDPDVIIAHRPKRLESIELKLSRGMRLTQIQDIGGCRAIFKDCAAVQQMLTVIGDSFTPTPQSQVRFSLKMRDNYIDQPKINGYRGVHFIARREVGVKLQVEIQIRSKFQHLWATAVEICQFFKRQRFKTLAPDADQKWLRFFSLASGLIALKEQAPIVPNIPTSEQDIRGEMTQIDQECGISTSLMLWSNLLSKTGPLTGSQAHYFVLDLNHHNLNISGFLKDDLKEAEQMSLKLEQEAEGDMQRQVVLVSLDNLGLLASAYPNYAVDALPFLALISAG